MLNLARIVRVNPGEIALKKLVRPGFEEEEEDGAQEALEEVYDWPQLTEMGWRTIL